MKIICAFLLLLARCVFSILDGLTCSDVGAVKLRLEEEKEKRLLLENDIEILMLKVADLTRTVKQNREVSLPISDENVAFMVYRGTSLTHLGIDQKVVFDRIVTNEGNGYSAITGIFTTPITGTYFFTWSTACYKAVSNSDLVTGIVVNGENKVHIANSIGAGFQMGSNSAIFRLNASDTVWIGVQHGSGVFSNSESGWYYPTFSGFMLHS